MSMIRTSGAMPAITALQIATASFAVPKSVIKTIVGLRAAVAAEASLGTGAFAQPSKNPKSINETAKNDLLGSRTDMRFLSFSSTQYMRFAKEVLRFRRSG